MKTQFIGGFFILMMVMQISISLGADIEGTKHDLVGVIPGLNDPCRACHGGAHHWLPGTQGLGRLSRDATNVYNSVTFDHDSQLTIETVNTLPSDIPLCLSCHDGAYVSAMGGTGELPDMQGSSADLTRDLRDDHPVGFHFDSSLDKEIKNPSIAKVSFGAEGDMMWCSSCHDVHDNSYPPFLVMANNKSALCFDCHIK